MASCTQCNGWGWVFRLRQPPPSTRERREETLRQFVIDPTRFLIAQQVCVACGGYGQRPE